MQQRPEHVGGHRQEHEDDVEHGDGHHGLVRGASAVDIGKEAEEAAAWVGLAGEAAEGPEGQHLVHEAKDLQRLVEAVGVAVGGLDGAVADVHAVEEGLILSLLQRDAAVRAETAAKHPVGAGDGDDDEGYGQLNIEGRDAVEGGPETLGADEVDLEVCHEQDEDNEVEVGVPAQGKLGDKAHKVEELDADVEGVVYGALGEVHDHQPHVKHRNG